MSETQNDPQDTRLGEITDPDTPTAPEPAAPNERMADPETGSRIYLGTDGGYHDNTPENRERFPAQADTDAQEITDLAEQVGGEPVPFTDEGKVDTEALAAGTIDPAGDGANTGNGTDAADSPEGSEVPSGESTPKATGSTAKTRKQ